MELFYYTTTETMRYVVTKGDIYATNVRYLNDSEEYINGLREIKKLYDIVDKSERNELAELAEKQEYEKIKEDASDIYSISFSKASDLLSQWHMYAKESGVQIKMNFDEKKEYLYYCQKCDGKKGAKVKKFETKPVFYLTQVGMPEEEYEQIGKQVQEQFSDIYNENMEMVSTWKILAPFIKNYGFKQEEEVRAVFLSSQNELQIEYRNDRGVLKPYLDIEMKNGWPISEIMVGPGRNQNQVFQSICHFLDHSDIKIDKVDNDKLICSYFDGMKQYGVSEIKINECKDKVLNVSDKMMKFGVRYSEKIKETLKICNFDEKEKKIVDNYIQDNFFCEKGIIVNKSKWPYEF